MWVSLTGTRSRCKIYSAAPPNGDYIETMEPGTRFGPVLEVRHLPLFAAVRVDAGWVNVWTCARGSTGGRHLAHLLG